ncbi:predicted protein [Chaetomium globosum CBS 148.51]|uniref:Uncharacterized protein n=1 Tax=Chaetomium globosum (strain ATCC 6205 / CBS 148.51 / DSM 1962 / NBRC 6347 / NRRL 1970) TaxID=306901 RepID=Q2HHR2_CHAGB|nr:uncharacterized protein CHGG_00242 [Chaetomium globosum CBS 148.51]EAQ92007.1 predicted protein [Chaetomium globosum CBS 148.51]
MNGCRQAGEKCVYLPTCRPNKADLAQKLDTLQQRLGRFLQLQVAPVGAHIMMMSGTNGGNERDVNAAGTVTEKAEAYIRKMDNEANCTKTAVPSYFSPPPTMSPASTPRLPLQMPPFGTPPTPTSFTPGLYHPEPRIKWPELLGNDFLYTPLLDSQMQAGGMDGTQLDGHVDGTDLSEHARSSSSISIPSLREIRELSSALYTTDRVARVCDTCNAATAELEAYCMTAFSAHSDIAGISLALAEYLAWMRKGANLKTDNIASMLETLEFRAREVHEIAEARPWAAWRNMVLALKPLGRAATRLAELEEDLGRQSAEAGHFFQTEYDIRMTLADQRKSPVMGVGMELGTPLAASSDASGSQMES